MPLIRVDTFDEWRAAARTLLEQSVPPDDVEFRCRDAQQDLFERDHSEQLAKASKPPGKQGPRRGGEHHVPPRFLELARFAACHRGGDRFNILYRVLWRLTHGERHLLEIVTDDDVDRLHQMQRAVRRDAHKMKAFVRFRRITTPQGQEQFVAWHRPDHRILALTAPFFARRFPAMHWAILTPDESVVWDLKQLVFGPGVPASAAPRADELEALWRTYYASAFNPARINVKTMKREMPVRHWPTLPEADLIPELLADASRRVQGMLDRSEGNAGTAADFLPDMSAVTLSSLRAAAAGCRGCELYGPATQTVFGEGPAAARVMLVGEQPGDQEDVAGRPFVGPAGLILDQVLHQAGIDRSQVYVTNAVKHFKFESRGKRRLHKKPDARETIACQPWLGAEALLVRPEVIVCLGATAAQSIIGRDFRIMRQRGQWISTGWCPHTIATYHPSAALRAPDEARRADVLHAMRTDLRRVAEFLLSTPPT